LESTCSGTIKTGTQWPSSSTHIPYRGILRIVLALFTTLLSAKCSSIVSVHLFAYLCCPRRQTTKSNSNYFAPFNVMRGQSCQVPRNLHLIRLFHQRKKAISTKSHNFGNFTIIFLKKNIYYYYCYYLLFLNFNAKNKNDNKILRRVDRPFLFCQVISLAALVVVILTIAPFG